MRAHVVVERNVHHDSNFESVLHLPGALYLHLLFSSMCANIFTLIRMLDFVLTSALACSSSLHMYMCT